MKSLLPCHYELLTLIVIAGSTTMLFWFTNLDQWAAGLFFSSRSHGRSLAGTTLVAMGSSLQLRVPFHDYRRQRGIVGVSGQPSADSIRSVRRQALYILLVIDSP